ncbi:MAG: hypothetical protein OXE17_08350 [Chloroflexi bacterium]|nr:hypothetical protein [Chloroflexota bacterium]
MPDTEVETLAALLGSAISSTVMRSLRGDYFVDVASFRRWCEADRQRPPRTMVEGLSTFTAFEPEIQDSMLREQLVRIIRSHLHGYIREDTLQTATIVAGGSIPGPNVDDLLAHMVKVAILRGSGHAACSFYEHEPRGSVPLLYYVLLSGVQAQRTLEIGDGIRLIPVPNDSAEMTPYFPDRLIGSTDPTTFFGMTLLAIDEIVSPTFANADELQILEETGGQGVFRVFQRRYASADYPEFDIPRFLGALSLATGSPVQSSWWWSKFHESEVYAVQGGIPSSGGYIRQALYSDRPRPVEIDGGRVREALSLYHLWDDLNGNDAERLRTPIDRWTQSVSTRNVADAFIDLRIALESLYLSDIRSGGEFRFRLGVRGAWHLGADLEERMSLRREFMDVYDHASGAVHTGSAGKVTRERLELAQHLCQRSIIQVLRDGRIPDWNELVLGGG